MDILHIINVLGSVVTIYRDNSVKKNGNDGECHTYGKTISIADKNKMFSDDSTDIEKTKRYKEVMRHELMHSFFYEAGRNDWSDDEILVDFIAVMYPKIKKMFEECDCED